jgi:hypothetical protein
MLEFGHGGTEMEEGRECPNIFCSCFVENMVISVSLIGTEMNLWGAHTSRVQCSASRRTHPNQIFIKKCEVSTKHSALFFILHSALFLRFLFLGNMTIFLGVAKLRYARGVSWQDGLPIQGNQDWRMCSEGVALGYDGSGFQPWLAGIHPR